jgi:hypothetical protein
VLFCELNNFIVDCQHWNSIFRHVLSSFDTNNKCSVPHIRRSNLIYNITSLILSNLSCVEMIVVIIILYLKTYLIENDCHFVNDSIFYWPIEKVAKTFLLSGCYNLLWFLSSHYITTLWRGSTLLVHFCWLGLHEDISFCCSICQGSRQRVHKRNGRMFWYWVIMIRVRFRRKFLIHLLRIF